MSLGTQNLWSEEELAAAIEDRANGLTLKELAYKYGRSERAVRAKFERSNMTPEQRARRLFHWRKRYARAAVERLSVAPLENVVVPITIPPFVIADLERRLSIIPTLDHVLQGTPLPTCSAFDRPAGLYYAT